MSNAFTHIRDECMHGNVVRQCRCPSLDKDVSIVPCLPSCPEAQREEMMATIKDSGSNISKGVQGISTAAGLKESLQIATETLKKVFPEKTVSVFIRFLDGHEESYYKVSRFDPMGSLSHFWFKQADGNEMWILKSQVEEIGITKEEVNQETTTSMPWSDPSVSVVVDGTGIQATDRHGVTTYHKHGELS